jgi:FkbM family methyltransferase
MSVRASLRHIARRILIGSPPPPAESPPPPPPPPPARLYAYLGPDVALTQLVGGLFLFVDPGDADVSSHMIGRGYWEMWVDNTLARLLRPGDRVAEVGANLGFYTVKMAAAIGPTGRLDSFEANPALARLVARSVEFNGFTPHTGVHAQAAGDRAATVQFQFARNSSGSGHLGTEARHPDLPFQPMDVPMVRLDDVLPAGPLNLIRIDAEGAEPLVLAGGAAVIDRSPDLRICMEWGVDMMAQMADVPGFIAWLRAKGFGFWRIAHDETLVAMDDAALIAAPLCDVLLSRGDPMAR